MGFVKIGNIDTFFTELNNELQKTEDSIIERLKIIGERAVAQARNKANAGTYTDQTGNLRSSIGYVILRNGKPIHQSKLEVVKEGAMGAKAGEKLLQKLSGEFSSGLTLILCAGMEYASYVEDIHHKDVLTSARLLAEKLINRYFKK